MEDTAGAQDTRGVKRKASDPPLAAAPPMRIEALDTDVVNKIAAGEIIVAPVHALKELIENAVDAGSTSLEILVKDGGLKLLQITDNGHGIDRDDLSILCERFTTSKLKKFEDLTNIGTYGFRGEALASISHIAHLTVTTKTKTSNCAWRAHYDGGKLAPAKPGHSSDPKPTAGRNGTQLAVEDLFYNVPTRRKAFRSAADEYNKIMDMVGRYAVHCDGVAFSCKKHGDAGTSISVQSQATTIDRIRQIHGSGVANELIQYSVSDERWGFKASGWATNANYHIKKTTLLLFINHRSVESSHMKKALEQSYSAFLPKNGHPFVYLNLEIDPQRVDVNVHPTKREVNFLNEDEIIQAICESIREKLAAVDTSRTFKTQTLLPGVMTSTDQSSGQDLAADSPSSSAKPSGNARRTPGRPYENNLVRTDASLRKITSMFETRGSSLPPGKLSNPLFDEPTYDVTDRQPVACRLTSVRELRTAVRDDMHHELTEIMANHTFVGVVDERRRLAAIQGGVKLFLVDYGRACFEYFYQVGLTDFGNFGTIRFAPALSLRELLTLAAEHEKATAADGSLAEDDGFDVGEVVGRVADQLIERREMLLEYFSLDISPAGELLGLPLLLRGYTPPLAKLPQFLLRLGPHVDWTDEKACFESFLRELATFYVPEQLPPMPAGAGAGKSGDYQNAATAVAASQAGDGETGAEEDGERMDTESPRSAPAPEETEDIRLRRDQVRRVIEHVLFPAFRARLVATKSFMKGGVLELANLKGLYRVFERC